MNKIKVLPSNRLQYFPIMMFAVVMGLAGLSLVYKKAAIILGFPSIIGDILSIFTIVVYISIVCIYIAKMIFYFTEVKNEFKHPVRINFFAASSIATLLVSLISEHSYTQISEYLAIIGSVMHLAFTFLTIKYWINNDLNKQHSNPAWLIPIVGNVIVPLATKNIFAIETLYFYFSIGMFFWIILIAILFNRMIFNNQLIPKFMPTLFILIAPPSVGFLSYYKITEQLDFFAYFLFSLGLFFSMMILVMYKNFVKIKFFISWWAFTFPMAAMSLASIVMYSISKNSFYGIVSYIFIVCTTFIVTLVAIQTIKHMFKNEICIME